MVVQFGVNDLNLPEINQLGKIAELGLDSQLDQVRLVEVQLLLDLVQVQHNFRNVLQAQDHLALLALIKRVLLVQ